MASESVNVTRDGWFRGLQGVPRAPRSVPSGQNRVVTLAHVIRLLSMIVRPTTLETRSVDRRQACSSKGRDCENALGRVFVLGRDALGSSRFARRPRSRPAILSNRGSSPATRASKQKTLSGPFVYWRRERTWVLTVSAPPKATSRKRSEGPEWAHLYRSR